MNFLTLGEYVKVVHPTSYEELRLAIEISEKLCQTWSIMTRRELKEPSTLMEYHCYLLESRFLSYS